MTASAALGLAVYFDFALSAEPAPFARLVESLFGTKSAALSQFYVPLSRRKAPPPAALNLAGLLRRIGDGTAYSAAVETRPGTIDEEAARVSATTVPASSPEIRGSQTACRFDLNAYFGAGALRAMGAQRVVDAVIAFADAVSARAGVILWAETTTYAACLAACSGSTRLSVEQDRRVLAAMDGRSRWGEHARGPAWGTFLDAPHVERLGGVARIERESGCYRVVALAHGGALLQLTAVDEPVVDEDPRVAAIGAYLAPVLALAGRSQP